MQRVLQVHLDRRMVVFAARAEVLLRPMPPRAPNRDEKNSLNCASSPGAAPVELETLVPAGRRLEAAIR